MKQITIFSVVIFLSCCLSGCKPAPMSLGGIATLHRMGYIGSAEYFKTRKIPFYAPLPKFLSDTGLFKSISDKSLGADGNPSAAPVFYMITAGSGSSLQNSEITLLICCKFDNYNYYQRIVECSGQIIIRSNEQKSVKLNEQNVVALLCLLYESRTKNLNEIINYYLEQIQPSPKPE